MVNLLDALTTVAITCVLGGNNVKYYIRVSLVAQFEDTTSFDVFLVE